MKDKMTNIIEHVYSEPNKEKIENAEGLKNYLDVCKEHICLYFEESKDIYTWQTKVYNSNYYELSDKYSISIGSKIKERLWTHTSWRFFIRILQKTGIIKFLKKIKNSNREE